MTAHNNVQRRRNRLDTFILGTALLSLLSTFTNFLPLSVSLSLLGPLFLVLLLYRTRGYLPPVSLVTALLLSYFALWTLFYDPSALLSYEFYRRDGNAFATLAPILILPLAAALPNKRTLLTILSAYVAFIAVLFGLLLAAHLAFGLSFRSHASGFLPFYAHNAAGGVLAEIVVLTLGLYLVQRKSWLLLVLLATAVMLYLTDSRGSILAVLVVTPPLIAVAKWPHLFRPLMTRVFPVAFLVALALMLLAVFAYLRPVWLSMDAPYTYQQSDEIPNIGINRGWTIENRLFFLWPRAADLFLKSPVVGAGFGAFNDIPYDLVGTPGWVAINRGNYEYSPAHAHNSFLHILAETGVLGLALTTAWILLLNRALWKRNPLAVALPLSAALWVLAVSSFAEHRLVSPSQALPVMLACGLGLSDGTFRDTNMFALWRLHIPRRFRRITTEDTAF